MERRLIMKLRLFFIPILFLLSLNSQSKTTADFPVISSMISGTGQQGLFYYFICENIEKEYSDVSAEEVYRLSVKLLQSKDKEAQIKGLLMRYYSARKGSSEAQFEVSSDFYRAGKYEDFIYWLEKSSNSGSARATYNLGVMYGKGFAGKDKNEEKAAVLYSKSCDMGFKQACH